MGTVHSLPDLIPSDMMFEKGLSYEARCATGSDSGADEQARRSETESDTDDSDDSDDSTNDLRDAPIYTGEFLHISLAEVLTKVTRYDTL